MAENEFDFTLWGSDGKQKLVTPVCFSELSQTPTGTKMVETFNAAVADDLCRSVHLDFIAAPGSIEAPPSVDVDWRPLTPTSAVGVLRRQDDVYILTAFLTGIDRQAEDGPTIGALEKMIAEQLSAYPSVPLKPLRWETSARPTAIAVSFGLKDWDNQSVNALACLAGSYFHRKGVA